MCTGEKFGVVETGRFRKRAVVVLVGLSGMAATFAAFADPNILAAGVNATGTQITLRGTGFGTSGATVRLANVINLGVVSQNNTQVVASVPTSLVPASYLLTLSVGRKGADAWVTIGAQGAAGPQGTAGPQGAAGPPGPSGPSGPIGLTGVKGDKGDTGERGYKGDTGAPGPAGTSGGLGWFDADGELVGYERAVGVVFATLGSERVTVTIGSDPAVPTRYRVEGAANGFNGGGSIWFELPACQGQSYIAVGGHPPGDTVYTANLVSGASQARLIAVGQKVTPVTISAQSATSTADHSECNELSKGPQEVVVVPLQGTYDLDLEFVPPLSLH